MSDKQTLTPWNISRHDGYRFEYEEQIVAATAREARKAFLSKHEGTHLAKRRIKASRVYSNATIDFLARGQGAGLEGGQ